MAKYADRNFESTVNSVQANFFHELSTHQFGEYLRKTLTQAQTFANEWS
jgi:hypothetical protein